MTQAVHGDTGPRLGIITGCVWNRISWDILKSFAMKAYLDDVQQVGVCGGYDLRMAQPHILFDS